MSLTKGKKSKGTFCKKFGFALCQQNGQRTYGGPPPKWGSKPPPSRDSEVFIGRLPRMCFEDELIPLFLTAGELYEFRLMLDFSGTNRGYGYAHYVTLDGAQRAIEKLNKYEIRPGHHIGVLKSKNNCRLLFGNIKSAMDIGAFDEFIRTATDQVLNVIMFKNFQQLKQTDFRISSDVEEAFLSRVPRNSGNSQFAIVEYENHKAAAVARRVLIPKYGHVLAIDWAVPPREKKRFFSVTDANFQAIERPLSISSGKDSNLHYSAKTFSKIRPVPTLVIQPSFLDDVSFMPKNFQTLVKFFKYQLSICLYKSVDQLEIPLFVCKEIERKIVDRVTNLENCGQAVQLIFNYFSWYNEKKRFVINSEVQKLLQEVKMYADSFVLFVSKKLKYGPSDVSEDNYYMHLLPLQLNILFRIILRSDQDFQVKLSAGITEGLKWLMDITQNGEKFTKDFIEEIVNHIRNEDGPSLDKATTLAKNMFLNTVTSQRHLQNSMMIELPENSRRYLMQSTPELERKEEFRNGRFSQKAILENKQQVEHNQCVPYSGYGKLNEPTPDAFPSVPLLLIQPSITNKVPFMPDTFSSVLTYFKNLIRLCLSLSSRQMNIPQHICNEIEKNIIDRISNMENCSEGVHLIITYFSWWVEKHPCRMNLEVEKLLHEVKAYADSFVDFIWTKTMSLCIPNEVADNYFCKVLPLRLNLLFQMMLIFNTDNPKKYFIGISKGLNWLEGLIRREDKAAAEFLKELTRFIVELNPEAYERAKCLGKVFCTEMMISNGHAINFYEMTYLQNGDQVPQSSSVGTRRALTLSGSDAASVSTWNFGS